MAEARARAPGKIILAGEHAVVHGSTAVAAAIGLYTHVAVRFDLSARRGFENGDASVDLEIKDVGLTFSWPSLRLKEVLGEASTVSLSTPVACSPERMRSIDVLVDEHNIPEAQIWLSSGISAFLYLYTSIHGYKRGTVVVKSDLPLGAGLGSSASFCVSLAGALLALSDATSIDTSQTGWLKFNKTELELVNKWAYEGEKIIHGKPSGIDNTVSTLGSMIQFRLGELIHIRSSSPIRILITNTKVGRNTKALVAGVSERASRHPDAMASVFAAVDSISKEMATIIQSPASDGISATAREEKIKELLEMNQSLLQCMGVSHASIEIVLRTTLRYKLTSKLTGAGGGGCVLTLIPKSLSCTTLNDVIMELESFGFQCLTAEAGGEGLEVCFSER